MAVKIHAPRPFLATRRLDLFCCAKWKHQAAAPVREGHFAISFTQWTDRSLTTPGGARRRRGPCPYCSIPDARRHCALTLRCSRPSTDKPARGDPTSPASSRQACALRNGPIRRRRCAGHHGGALTDRWFGRGRALVKASVSARSSRRRAYCRYAGTVGAWRRPLRAFAGCGRRPPGRNSGANRPGNPDARNC